MKRHISILMTLVMMAMLLGQVLSLPAAADALDWSGATTTTLGKYMSAADADNANNLLVNAVAGPYSGVSTSTLWNNSKNGEDVSFLIDGQFELSIESDSHYGRVECWVSEVAGAVAQFTYQLDEEYNLTHFLTATEADSNRWVQDIKIYAGTELASLYTTDNLVVNAQDVNMQNVYYATDAAKTATYVGFEFYVPDDNVWGKRLCLCELGVYGTKVVKPYEAATTTDLENNLLEKVNVPFKGVDKTSMWTVTADGQGGIPILADGSFHVANNNSTRAMFKVTANAATQFSYDLGTVCTVDRYVVGFAETDSQYWLPNIQVYASTTLSSLYDSANMVVNVTDCGAVQNVLYRSASTTARYVGFVFTAPVNYLRLSEIGVFGTKGTTGFEIATDTDYANNLLKNLGVPFKGTVVTDLHEGKDNSDINNLVNGSFYDKDNVAATRAMLGLDSSGTTTVSYDLGSTYLVDRILVASAETGGQYWVEDIQLYASSALSDLYSAENRVIDAQGVNMQNVSYYFKEKPARYIGFAFANQSDWGRLRLGELGVYGTSMDTLGTAFFVTKGAGARGTSDLRFGFNLTAKEVDYEDKSHTNQNFACAALTAATVEVNGETYPLKSFGAVVSISADEKLVTDNTSAFVKTVPAVNLYDDVDDITTYTAVVTDIPAAHTGTLIYARPYAVITIGGTDYTVYGETKYRSINGVNGSTDMT